MIFPGPRRVLSSGFIRLTMFSPRESDEVVYVSPKDLNWQVTDLDGNRVNINNESGKPKLINFWATWCPPCLAEMPSLNHLFNEYGDKVDFYMISSEEASVIEKFLERKEYSFPVYALNANPPELFISRSIPATFIISPKGQVVMKKQGAARWDSDGVKELLDKLIR